MPEVKFDIPEGLLLSLNESASEFSHDVRLFSALHLFKLHKLSLGKAAELAGMNKYDFMLKLSENEIPVVDYDPEELDRELDRFKI